MRGFGQAIALEITVGPSQLALHQGNSVLLTERDGKISWPSDKGLYFFDTRLISSWSIYANGELWGLLNAGNITHYASRIFLTNRAIATEDGEMPPRTLGLVLSRSINGGVHEDLDLVNNGMNRVRFNLEIAIRSDFADLFEVKSGHIVGKRNFDLRFWRAGDKNSVGGAQRDRDAVIGRSYASGSDLRADNGAACSSGP